MVQALDLKSKGKFPRRFDPCSQCSIFFSFRNILGKSWEHEPILVFASNWDWRTKDSQYYFSWKGHVGDSVWKRPARQFSAKKSKISASKKLYEDGIRFHQNKININRATLPQWLRRWTWNPMGTSRARSSPARSLRSHFSKRYSEKVGNTNQYLCSQATETDEPKSVNYFSWKGNVGDSVWKRPPRQLSAKNRRLAQAKICPRTESESIKTRLMSK